MNLTRDFHSLRSNELWVVRHGIYNPLFEITDGDYCYAEINTKLNSIGVEKDKWIFKKNKTWTGKYATVMINNFKDENIGSLTYNEMKHALLQLNDGFKASFIKKNSFFSHLSPTYIWAHSSYGDIITIEQSKWRFKKMFKITLDDKFMKDVPDLLSLMILYGVGFMLFIRGFDIHIGQD
jgi:hypothetical protein